MLDRLLQVDDVNAGTVRKDERLHLWVPSLGLVTEVDSRVQELTHCDRGQLALLLDTEVSTQFHDSTGRPNPWHSI